jgi:hypothetical protein
MARQATYRVFVDDNFHYMDESERYHLGDFETLEAAVAACQKVVDESLAHHYERRMTADELMAQYVMFGDDPFVHTGDGSVPFSAREYAARRAREMCRPG